MAADPALFATSDAVPAKHSAIDQPTAPPRFPSTTEEHTKFDRRFGAPWSIRSLRTCLGLTLVYCWIAYFLGWGLGGSGRLGNIRLLADPGQPARLIGAISAIAFPMVAMLIGRSLGRLERRTKLSIVRRWRRAPTQYRKRLRINEFERRYRWLLGVLFGTALVAALIWFRRGDVAAFAIVFSWLALGPVSGIAVARRFASPTSQGLAALLAGFGSISGAVLLILAFAGAGVSAFAFAILGVTNVAFTGAIGVLLDIVMGGALTFGLALAGAGVATVALALAGAGTGIATLTGVATMSRAGLAAFVILMSGAAVATMAFREAAVLSAAIGGISALAVAAAVSHNRMGHHGAYAGAIGSIALMTTAAVLFGWGDKPLVIFAVCFFFLLPLLVGVVAWLALGLMRSLSLWAAGRGWSSLLLVIIACFVIGGTLAATLAYVLGYGAEAYNQLTLVRSGTQAFDAGLTIVRTVRDPFGEGLWLSALVLIPLLPPILLSAAMMTDALLVLQPHDYRFRRLLFRTTGATLALVPAVSAVGLVTSSAELDAAPFLGDLARAGLDAVALAFEPSMSK